MVVACLLSGWWRHINHQEAGSVDRGLVGKDGET